MRGSEWVKALQEAGIEDIQRATMDAIADGDYLEINFTPIAVDGVGTRLICYVMAEPLRIGEPGDFVYAMVSAETQQLIVDELGLEQPTTRLMDETRLMADVQIDFEPQPADPAARRQAGLVAGPEFGGDGYKTSMSDAYSMWVQTERILGAASGRPGALALPYKAWVLDERISESKAANYGGYARTAKYTSVDGQSKLWQPLGLAHDPFHFDYSQVFFCLHPECRLDGAWTTIHAIGTDPELCKLVSDTGVITKWRQPVVPDFQPPTVPDRPAPLTYQRLLMLRSPAMTGADVDAWRRFLGLDAGPFDAPVDEGTRAWQRVSGLDADGKVGRLSIDEANRQIREGR